MHSTNLGTNPNNHQAARPCAARGPAGAWSQALPEVEPPGGRGEGAPNRRRGLRGCSARRSRGALGSTGARSGEVRHSLASIDKARELVGYEPVVEFDEGLRQTVAYYRAERRDRRRVRAA